jgi:hypothetical protein
MKAIYQWTLHELVIKVLFHCASAAVNDLKCGNGSRKLKQHLTTNDSHMSSKSTDYFE